MGLELMSVAIRSAGSHDVPAILALERQSPTAAHWSREEYNKLVNSGTVLIAEEAGDLRGEEIALDRPSSRL